MKTAIDHLDRLVARHLRIGWWSLLVFATLGLVLESLHGFKVRWLVDVSNETRRLMWTLAHAHGTLLGLVHLGFATTLRLGRPAAPTRTALASSCLSAASIAIPLGFLLGGTFAQAGDPGIGIVLVPVGGVALLLGCGLVVSGLSSAVRSDRRAPTRSDDVSRVK